MEIWGKIPNFEGYEISNYGRIKRLCGYTERNRVGYKTDFIYHSEIILKTRKNYKGYLDIDLYKTIDGKTKRFKQLIHRLVAIVFLPEPTKERVFVNHINGLKDDNNVNNLEWCTNLENMQHALDNNLISRVRKKGSANKQSKTVYQFTKDNVLIQKFGSIAEAFRVTKVEQRNIGKVCKGERKFAGGFIWSFTNN